MPASTAGRNKSMSPITQASAGGAATRAMAARGGRGRARRRLDTEPMAERVLETSRHAQGVCLMNRLARRRAFESRHAGAPRQLATAV